MSGLIDTHCHLNDPSFGDRLAVVMERAKAAGVCIFIVPTYDVESLYRTAQMALTYPDAIFPAYGIHPWFLGGDVDWEMVRHYIERAETVAVGEIGLDLSPECPPADVQIPALIRQLEMAAEVGLPVIIHCRKAYGPLYDILKPFKGSVKGVLHSYSGSRDAMDRFIDLGFYIGFSGSVTRRTARKYHKTAQSVPSARILLETDAPSIATETTVASEVEPRHVLEVAKKIADLRGLDEVDVCRLATENAWRLFQRLPQV